MISNLLSGFIGALLGAAGSLGVAIYSNKKEAKSLEVERLRGYVASAIFLAGQLLDNFLSFKPSIINRSSFGMRVEEGSLVRVNQAIRLHGEAKYLEHLLPEHLRNRWDLLLVLITEFSATESLDLPNRNRAQVDVENFIQYVRDSCVDFLDGNEVRKEIKRPYLKRDDPIAWNQMDFLGES